MLDRLTEDQRAFVDEMLYADMTLRAMQFVMAAAPCCLRDVQEPVYRRKQELGIDFGVQALARDEAFITLSKIKEKICVIEGSWDGDDRGWFIRLSAITNQPSKYHANFTEHGLCFIEHLDAQVERAVALGEELAQYAHTTFFLTDTEIDDRKRWWDTQPISEASKS